MSAANEAGDPPEDAPVTGPYFVDTNLLVYLRDSTDPEKQRRAAEWMTHLWDSRSGRVSLQVLQEYYVTVTGKLDPGMPQEDARDDVVVLRSWRPLEPDLALIQDAWAVQDRFGFSFWDAQIVAAARRLGCSTLLTEDLQDRQDLGGVVVRNPFVEAPPE